MNRKGRRKSPQLKAMQKEWGATGPPSIPPKPYGSAKNNKGGKRD